MIEFVSAPDHVVAMRVIGTLTGGDFDRMIAEFEARLQRHEEIGLYADMVGFEDMTAEAFGKDMSYSFGKLGQWKRFRRNAVITDKRWMRMYIKTIDSLVPNFDVRAFEPSEREAAMAWVSAVRPA